MKKLITILLLAICLSANSQTPQAIKPDEIQVQGDTLIIPSTAKFIRVNGNVIATEGIKEKGFWFTQAILNKVIEAMQELPGKVCNPASDFLYKFFGLK